MILGQPWTHILAIDLRRPASQGAYAVSIAVFDRAAGAIVQTGDGLGALQSAFARWPDALVVVERPSLVAPARDLLLVADRSTGAGVPIFCGGLALMSDVPLSPEKREERARSFADGVASARLLAEAVAVAGDDLVEAALKMSASPIPPVRLTSAGLEGVQLAFDDLVEHLNLRLGRLGLFAQRSEAALLDAATEAHRPLRGSDR